MSQSEESLDKEIRNAFLPMLVFSGALLSFLIGFIVFITYKDVNATELDRYEEDRIIEVLYTDPPKHFKIHYKDLNNHQVYHEASKHCGNFTEDKYKVGHKYHVKIQFKVTQYKFEKPEHQRLTSGCDLYSQNPIEVV